MIEMISYFIMSLSVLVFIVLGVWYFYIKFKHEQRINRIFSLEKVQILSSTETKKKEDFKLKLIKAGITQKHFNEVIVAGIVTCFSLLYLVYILKLTLMMNVLLILIAVSIAIFMPMLYLEEQIKARIKRIDNDLAIFIDLLIIILEGGGGLNNAIDRVTTDGENVLGPDLLEESRKFKNEYITYSSEIAYNNLALRTGSEAIGAIVGFMKLSEETGIGVKTIFENQAEDIKAAEILNVEKGAASMNIWITLTMFIFIIPAVIAMIAFPMAADALMPGF
ncbi:type II secretion system F family protein [Sulfurimonas sp. SAG-AH-194-L11]|nr:type II secretion system F family protein [Sulfurimonas sp. SAG-AH-194-L11]MDF1876848.1 type II secretion system F family protein [Sulfurimonas sp. SAG-AH-194-L11]